MVDASLISLPDSVVDVSADTWILLSMSVCLAAICTVEYEACRIPPHILTSSHRSDTGAAENTHIKVFYNL